MKERLLQIIQQYQMTAARFADEIQVQRSGISHILSGRNQPSYDFITKVIEKFPDVDTEWLLTGKGNMKKTASFKPPREPTLFDHEVKSEDAAPYSKNEAKSSPKTKVTNVTIVEKIVIFYSDGTFKAYEPHMTE